MKPETTTIKAAAVLILLLGACQAAPYVDVQPDEQSSLASVTVDQRPFATYRFGTTASLSRPVLHPVWSPSGQRVTRGFPLDPEPGERADHPHQIGMWLAHGDVNGIDFWTIHDGHGSIEHREILEATSGENSGSLRVGAGWVGADGTDILAEETSYRFSAAGAVWTIDRTTRLTATLDTVIFRDSIEGMMGIRVAAVLEGPSNRADLFVDQNGSLTDPRVDSSYVTGRYISSAGLFGDAVWGSRAEWMALQGEFAGDPVTLAILDHPANPGHPTHWMARDYGLFAANPLGPSVYDEGLEPLNLTLTPGESVTFRYQLLIRSGPAPPPDWITERYNEFATSP